MTSTDSSKNEVSDSKIISGKQEQATKVTPKLKLWALAWPILIEQLTGVLVSFADIYFLSLLSDEIAATVGLLMPIILLGSFILPLFSTAGTAVACQLMGAQQTHRVVPTYMANVGICSLFALVLATPVWVFSSQIGLWFGMTETQNGYAHTFLFLIAFTFLPLGLRFSYSSILASRGLTHWNMIAALLTNGLNIFLNYVFIMGVLGFPKMGLEGVALSSIISYSVGALLLVAIVHLHVKIRFYLQGALVDMRNVIRPILQVGIPNAVEPMSYIAQSMFVSWVIVSLGVTAMGANTYAMRLLFFVIAVSWTLASAGQIIMSYYLGQGDIDRVKATFYRVLRYSIIFALTAVTAFAFFTDVFLEVFTEDTAIIELAHLLFLVALVMEPARMVNIIGGVALKSTGDGRFSATMSVTLIWSVVPFLIFLQKTGAGLVLLWVVLAIDEILRACFILYRWHTEGWRGKSAV
ncbi:MATE family efflux transporter [Marinibactrum halimedae]|uniref:MATE family efflux transporter n=1 Tax=Marinibactrum halimedae TaxID=1444977 RepID=A0AA37T6N3_9GAMM|nr:MATE family efflux transporter [Marinibactrum halimedae]MCD9460362.1 MATE family efflux transporter [Marinibactrum halimedae]GLS26799.1 MATE family efflux transporter [Marinibactrum halimedae]